MDDDKPKQEYPKEVSRITVFDNLLKLLIEFIDLEFTCALCGEPTTGHLPFCLDCKYRWQPDGNGGWAVPAYEPEKFNTR